MSLGKYQAFALTAQLGSLTKAAQQLGYTQSGVSHLIHALEDELGFALLIRSRSGVSPTPEGEALLPYVGSMLASYEDIRAVAADFRGLSTGSLRVGTFSSVAIHWFPHILNSFTAQYPNINVSISNGTYETIEEELLENKTDCSFITLPSRPGFFITPLKRDRLMVVLHQDNPLAQKASLSPLDIADQGFILPAEGTNYDMGKAFAAAGAMLDVKYNVNDDYAALSMVREAHGITILPELIIRNQPLDGLCAVPLENADREIGLATNKSRLSPPALKAFLAHVKSMDLP